MTEFVSEDAIAAEAIPEVDFKKVRRFMDSDLYSIEKALGYYGVCKVFSN